MVFFLAVAVVLHPAFLMAALSLFAALHAKAIVAWLLASSVVFGMTTAGNVKHTFQQLLKNDSGAAVVSDAPEVITGNSVANFSEVIDPSATVEIDLAVDITKIKSAYLNSTQPCDVYTNAALGVGGQHIPLAAGISAVWNINMPWPNPFTPTITKFFITNNGSVAATVRAEFLLSE